MPNKITHSNSKFIEVQEDYASQSSESGDGGDVAWGEITGTLSSQADLQSALDAKQATLVSGTNIKTINGATILGSGDRALYEIYNVQALVSNTLDATDYYFGPLPKALQTTGGISRLIFRRAGTIIGANIVGYSGTVGSNEAWPMDVRLNNTTDTAIATVSAATAERIWNNQGLSIAIAADDYVEIHFLTPTWVAQNPASTIFVGYITFKPS